MATSALTPRPPLPERERGAGHQDAELRHTNSVSVRPELRRERGRFGSPNDNGPSVAGAVRMRERDVVGEMRRHGRRSNVLIS